MSTVFQESKVLKSKSRYHSTAAEIGRIIGQSIEDRLSSDICRYVSKNFQNYNVLRNQPLNGRGDHIHRFDLTISTQNTRPVFIQETKYMRRGAKHSAMRSSWISNSVSSIRERYPKVIPCACLFGHWSEQAQNDLVEDGIKLHVVTQERINNYFMDAGIDHIDYRKGDFSSCNKLCSELLDLDEKSYHDIIDRICGSTVRFLRKEIRATLGEEHDKKFTRLSRNAAEYMAEQYNQRHQVG